MHTTNALLIIDVQDFFLKDAPHDFANSIARHIEGNNYDHIVFTTFQNTPQSPFKTSLKWSKCRSPQDAALPANLAAYASSDNTFVRNTYSAFKHPDLHSYLQAHNISRLVLCGIDTDACVLATAYEAFDLGYHVKFEFDLCFSSAGLQDEATTILRRNISSRD